MAEGRIQKLLKAVWGNREGYVFLPHKDANREWHEVPGVPYDGREIPEVQDLRADMYFCPLVFSRPKRKKEYALPTNLLWADLDPVNPNDCRLTPSIAWESSPGRYQALWFLSTEIPAEEAAQLSKRIAYADGGDKGGWDVTQVLRIPGSRNYKYPSAPEVKLLWAKRNAYSTSEVKAAYPRVNGDAEKKASKQEKPDLWSTDVSEATISSAIASLPIGLRKRLSRSTAGADRSLELQKLSRDILRFGIDSSVTLRILQRSTWNKFSGRSDEQSQLLKQVEQALEANQRRQASKSQPSAPIQEMEVHKWGSFLQIPTVLRWLVEDSWVDQTVGFISGRSKSYKTWIALDLALSVVSGKPFLGRYPVRRTGPVLLIQEEDPAAVLQERLRLIGKMKGMSPTSTWDEAKQVLHIDYPDYPLHVINLQSFSLGVPEKVDQVRRLIARLNPIMVVLDPLVVMLGQVDEFKATEVAGVLQSVKMWREEFNCSVVIVHHWNKTKSEDGDRGGAHMYGSFAFHAWLESALHVQPVTDDADTRGITRVVVEREFKAAPSGRTLKLNFNIDSVEKYEYHVEFEDDKAISGNAQKILDVLNSGGEMSTPELVQATGIKREQLVQLTAKLVGRGLLEYKKGGGRGKSSTYRVPEPEA